MEQNNKPTDELQDELQIENGADDQEQEEDLSSQRKIYTESGDPEITSLLGRQQRGRLNVQPLFQRHFVWDRKKSSRLIESALLDIPLPIIYLAEEHDGKENVVDGQQRLTSFFSFITGKLPDNTDFKLTGLKVFIELNGKKFSQLSEQYQDKISYYPKVANEIANISQIRREIMGLRHLICFTFWVKCFKL